MAGRGPRLHTMYCGALPRQRPTSPRPPPAPSPRTRWRALWRCGSTTCRTTCASPSTPTCGAGTGTPPAPRCAERVGEAGRCAGEAGGRPGRCGDLQAQLPLSQVIRARSQPCTRPPPARLPSAPPRRAARSAWSAAPTCCSAPSRASAPSTSVRPPAARLPAAPAACLLSWAGAWMLAPGWLPGCRGPACCLGWPPLPHPAWMLALVAPHSQTPTFPAMPRRDHQAAAAVPQRRVRPGEGLPPVWAAARPTRACRPPLPPPPDRPSAACAARVLNPQLSRRLTPNPTAPPTYCITPLPSTPCRAPPRSS